MQVKSPIAKKTDPHMNPYGGRTQSSFPTLQSRPPRHRSLRHHSHHVTVPSVTMATTSPFPPSGHGHHVTVPSVTTATTSPFPPSVQEGCCGLTVAAVAELSHGHHVTVPSVGFRRGAVAWPWPRWHSSVWADVIWR